jgi:RNA polymerase sigma factor (sigma-70 family)
MHGGARAVSSSNEDELEAASGQPAPGTETSVAAVCLDTLYRQESPRLLRSLTRRTASREDAHDLLHEIFCRMARLREAGSLRLDRPKAYLSRIATNLLRDRAKQASRHMAASHVVADEGKLAGLDQQRLLESRDMLTRVEAAMLKLRPKTREIFMAHRIEGLSYAEIAERTGLSIKGVEKQMSKAIAQLDRMLDRLFESLRGFVEGQRSS